MNWTRRLLALPLTLAFALAACGGDDLETENELGVDTELGEEVGAVGSGFGEWDTDRDNRLVSNEFGGWMGGRTTYTDWDANRDNLIDEDEFGDGIFGLWDEDNDTRLSEAEWNEDSPRWFGTSEYGAWSDWDTDSDGYLTDTEFDAGYDRYGLYDTWDRDRSAGLDTNEFNEGWFGMFDENRDTYVDDSEWGRGTTEWELF